MLDARRSTLDARRSTLDARRSTLDARRLTLDSRRLERLTLDTRAPRPTPDARRPRRECRRQLLRSSQDRVNKIGGCRAADTSSTPTLDIGMLDTRQKKEVQEEGIICGNVK
jgi:hypothetical protein